MAEEISVIIPHWNRVETLERAIQSALCQSLPVAEVLVCDDGAAAASHDVVAMINDPRVRWVNGARGGRPAIPRNRGIRDSKGDWVAFLDDDDEWLPDKLERQLSLAQRLGCLAVCSDAFRVISGRTGCDVLLNWPTSRLTFSDLLEANRVICSSALVHRSLFEAIEGFPESPSLIACEDYALWLRVATQTDFAYVSEPLLYYLDDPANSVRKEAPDETTIRKHVLSDFKIWAARKRVQGGYKRAAERQHRGVVLEELKIACRAFASRLVGRSVR